VRHLYIHVPFCRRRCTYCDFSIAVRKVVPVAEYLRALEAELALRVPTPVKEPLETLYLGGGTPSLLGGEGVARLMDVVRARFTIADGAEITIEANPDDVTPDAARAWRAAGVNRISLGAQSFDQNVLEWMHRTHTPQQTERAVDIARGAGIDDLSIDLIFALPSSLRRDWERDISHVLSLAPQHLSFYGLTMEEGTPLGRWHARGDVAEAPEESYEREFLAAHQRLTAGGFNHYEVSNYAQPGARARHNSSYWRRVPYLGIGPSAHSFDGERRWWNIPAYAEWSRVVLAEGEPIEDSEIIRPSSAAAERIYLGLRTVDGLQATPAELAAARPWVSEGWAVACGERLSLTPSGWLRLDALASHLTVLASDS
jgi:oxygen-independent coproporphyrinogen-3 oxidase